MASEGAKRLDCAELAPAFGSSAAAKNASKLHALQTLRAMGMVVFGNVTVLMPACPNSRSDG